MSPVRWLPALLLVLLVLPGCTAAPPAGDGRGDGGVIAPTPERVERALRFAALAPLPAGAQVVRLEAQSGIDTRVELIVRLAAEQTAPWLAGSGLPVDVQQRVANPDGAVVYREARRVDAGPGLADVTVTAFTT